MIHICYGITKSASTFLYQLTEEILSGAGRTVCRIRRPGRSTLENYYDSITIPLLDEIESRARGREVVLKTHGRLDPAVAGRIAEGRIKASASFRDPREVALSMADNGALSRQLGIPAFSEIAVPEDALPSIDMQLACLGEWMAVPGVEAFSYNEVCFSTDQAVRRLCAQIGVAVDAGRTIAPFRNRMLIGQLNVARPLRYRDMDEATQAIFLQRYAAFYATVDLGEHLVGQADSGGKPAPKDVWTYHLENINRHLRRMWRTRSLGTIAP